MITKMFYRIGSSLKVRALGYSLRGLKAHLRGEQEAVRIIVEKYEGPFDGYPVELDFWTKPAGKQRFRRGF